MGVSKTFGTHIIEKRPKPLVYIFCFLVEHWITWAKMPIFGQKCQFLAKDDRLSGQRWPFLDQNSIFWGDGVKNLVHSYLGTNETPFLC